MIEIKTKEEFENLSKNGVFVVKFGAEWCGPCKAMHKTMETLSEMESLSSVVFAEVDIEENEELAQMFSIRNIPATLVFKDGEAVDMLIGYQTKSDMEEKITHLI